MQRSAALRTARNAHLVATGWLRTKSGLAPTKQQKYWDHGGSTALLTITLPISRAQILRLGREPQKRVNLALHE